MPAALHTQGIPRLFFSWKCYFSIKMSGCALFMPTLYLCHFFFASVYIFSFTLYLNIFVFLMFTLQTCFLAIYDEDKFNRLAEVKCPITLRLPAVKYLILQFWMQLDQRGAYFTIITTKLTAIKHKKICKMVIQCRKQIHSIHSRYHTRLYLSRNL